MRDVARLRDVSRIGRLLELLALRSAELFNASGFANDLGLRRETVEHYVAVLVRLFLVTLGGLRADHWLSGRDRMGHLLESLVVQQLVAQAA